ncbi:uncharacterized protein FIBRA_03677 [Fibroporia radiculosa]|uniref:chitin deacetylase n=1 Tax=Fibroporia radiculosa TaxID=599839 RepID=J4I9R4_9APHY|nr:uncharacterized protein FIBRA_03677 [Fibroporia radiculosa]CCM01616.1 predicted protein [Fibroporia radiculosa]
MTTRTNEQVIAELGWTRKVLRDITGVTPIYWRPPFGDIDDRVRAISIAMNLKPIIWTRINATMDFDTNDWGMIGGSSTAISTLDKWNEIMNVEANISTGFIALEHDLFEQTVDLAVGYILPEALAHQPKFNMTPIVECLDMPLANAYLETNDNSTNPPPLTAYLANRTIPGTTPPAGSSNSTGSSGGNPSASGSSDGSSGGSPGSSEKSGASSMMAVGPALLTAALGVVGSVGAIFL